MGKRTGTLLAVFGLISTLAVGGRAPAAAQTAQTLTLQVGASADDALANGGGTTAKYTSRWNQIYSNTANSRRVGSGMRFTNVAIPAGAQIVSATLQLFAGSSTRNAIDATLYGQAADSAGDFTTNTLLFNTTQRPRTGAGVAWTGALTFNVFNTSPDLTSIVQEIVNRPGWVSGNPLVVLALGDLATAATLQSSSFDRSSTQAPKLVISYADPAPVTTVFTDVTASAGVSYLQSAPNVAPCAFGDDCRPENMAGGAATGDHDGDGDLDLFVTRLDNTDLMFCNQLADGGGAVFTDCTAATGLAAFNLPTNGASFGDIDNDGDLDLMVTTIGDTRYYLFINDGTGFYTEDAVARGVAHDDGPHSGWSPAFGDYDRDGYLDLFVTEWRPDSETGVSIHQHSRLYHNRGSVQPGVFDDVTDGSGIDTYWEQPCTFLVDLCGEWGFAPAFTDLDGDGWPDLAIAADFKHSRLFWNNGDGTFTDGTVAAAVGTDQSGMGSTLGDYDNDGDLDWFITAIYIEGAMGKNGNRLFRNEGNRVFTDVTDAAGVRNGYWGWGTAFLDYENDGDLDLTQTDGQYNIDWRTDPMVFWRNEGAGVMTEMATAVGLTDNRPGKGLLVFDYDEDGDQDMFVVINEDTPVLYRNDGGNSGDWLRVETVGTISNTEGIGAWVTIETVAGGETQVREIGSVSHFSGHGETAAHFGLGSGDAPVATVTVRWPSGVVQVFTDVARNTTLTAVEPG